MNRQLKRIRIVYAIALSVVAISMLSASIVMQHAGRMAIKLATVYVYD
jgi:hypothetical protein